MKICTWAGQFIGFKAISEPWPDNTGPSSSTPAISSATPNGRLCSNHFAADGLELTLAFWIGDPHNGEGNVRSDVNLALLRTLNEAGVEIPFPQRVVRQAAG